MIPPSEAKVDNFCFAIFEKITEDHECCPQVRASTFGETPDAAFPSAFLFLFNTEKPADAQPSPREAGPALRPPRHTPRLFGAINVLPSCPSPGRRASQRRWRRPRRGAVSGARALGPGRAKSPWRLAIDEQMSRHLRAAPAAAAASTSNQSLTPYESFSLADPEGHPVESGQSISNHESECQWASRIRSASTSNQSGPPIESGRRLGAHRIRVPIHPSRPPRPSAK